jgi:hypothetical protein
MFLTNKYSKTYFNIITRAKLREVTGYTESHHIVPRCMGGLNDNDNLVSLTAREHLICHMLLPHMVSSTEYKSKLYHACGMMVCGNKHGRKYTSRQFERARLYHSKGNTLRQTGLKMNLSDSERLRRSAVMKEARKHRSYGPLSQTAKENISKGLLGNIPHNKGKPANRITCKHCNTSIGGESNFARWHGDNCKLNPNRKTDKNKLFSESQKKSFLNKPRAPNPKYECSHCSRMIGGLNNLAKHQSSCSMRPIGYASK